jgi:hypothetical protein
LPGIHHFFNLPLLPPLLPLLLLTHKMLPQFQKLQML